MNTFPQPGEIFSKRYELLEVLGTGGISTVYKALQIESKRKIALKIMHPKVNEDGDFTRRFIAEARVLNQLKHPNVVSIYHIGVSDTGLPYIAMELIRGKNLRQLLKDEGALPTLRAINIAKQIAEALAYVHSHNIVHRDLKPENFVILDQPAPDTVKLIDFGLARMTNSQQKSTSTGTVIGSIEYMSPEQCQGKVVDLRTDIYALGVCFFQMLTNKKPFGAENAVGLMYQHNTATVPLISKNEVDRFVPEINKLIAKAMAKSPDARFQTMAELSSALSALAELLEEAPSATPPAAVSQKAKNKNVALVVGLCAISIIGLSSISIAGLIKQNQKSLINTTRLRTLTGGPGPGTTESLNQDSAMEIIREALLGKQQYVEDPIIRLSARQATSLLKDFDAYARRPNCDSSAKSIFLIEISKLTKAPGSSQLIIEQALELAKLADQQQRRQRSKELLKACTAAYIEQSIAHKTAFQKAGQLCDTELQSTPKMEEYEGTAIYFRLLHPYTRVDFLMLKARLLKAQGHEKESEIILDEIVKTLRKTPNQLIIFPIATFLSVEIGDAQLKKAITELAQNSDKLIAVARACYENNRDEIGDYAMNALGPRLLVRGFYSSRECGEIQLKHIYHVIKKEGLGSKKARALAADLAEFVLYRGKSELTGYDRFSKVFQSHLVALLMNLNLKPTAHDLINHSNEKSSGVSGEELRYCLEELKPFASDKYIQRWMESLRASAENEVQ